MSPNAEVQRIGTFEHRGVHCYPDPKTPGVYRYVPGAPVPERTPDGAPAVSLITTGGFGLLQVGAEWAAEEPVLEELKNRILEARPDLEEVELRLAPVEVREARLVLRGDGEEALAASGSSGHPPFSAVFSVTLQGDRLEAVQKALTGRGGSVDVVYRVRLPSVARAQTSLRGEVEEVRGVLDPHAGPEERLAAIERALAEGWLELSRDRTPDASAELVDEADRRALEAAADALHELARDRRSFDRTELEVTESVETEACMSAERSAAIAAWLAEAEAGGSASARHDARKARDTKSDET